MKEIIRALALAGVGASLCACATITRGEHTAWKVETTPPGAQVKTTNDMHCDSTPCALTMARKAEFTATISKAGYKSVEVKVTHTVGDGGSAGMAGNIIFGGLIGAGVDATSGAMLDLTPNPVKIALEPEDKPAVATAPTGAAPVPPAPSIPPVAAAATPAVTALK